MARSAAWILLLPLAAHAAPQDDIDASVRGVLAESGRPSVGVSVRVDAQPPAANESTPRFDLRLWSRRGGAAFGAGLETAAPTARLPGSPSAEFSRTLVGARIRLSDGSGLYADRLGALTPTAAGFEPGQTATVRVGLEFKRASSQWSGLKTGSLLRVQLSGDANLSFRPRRGGLQVSYRAQF